MGKKREKKKRKKEKKKKEKKTPKRSWLLRLMNNGFKHLILSVLCYFCMVISDHVSISHQSVLQSL